MSHDDDDGTETVTVEIPLSGAVACQGCGDVGVNLEGELMPCSRTDCDYGRAFRAMTPPQRLECARYLRELYLHLRGCDYCQQSTRPDELCRTGRPLLLRLLAWILPGPTSKGSA